MNKLKALLKSFLSNKALWHFADDFGTYFVAGVPAIMAAFYIPTDGNWKLLIGGVVAAVIGVAYPALRRAWADNKVPVVQSVEADVTTATGIDIYALLSQLHAIEDMAEAIKAKYPGQYDRLIHQASVLLDQIISKVPVSV